MIYVTTQVVPVMEKDSEADKSLFSSIMIVLFPEA